MVRIRPATEADYEAVLRVQQEALGEYANVYHHLDLICFATYREPVASRLAIGAAWIGDGVGLPCRRFSKVNDLTHSTRAREDADHR